MKLQWFSFVIFTLFASFRNGESTAVRTRGSSPKPRPAASTTTAKNCTNFSCHLGESTKYINKCGTIQSNPNNTTGIRCQFVMERIPAVCGIEIELLTDLTCTFGNEAQNIGSLILSNGIENHNDELNKFDLCNKNGWRKGKRVSMRFHNFRPITLLQTGQAALKLRINYLCCTIHRQSNYGDVCCPRKGLTHTTTTTPATTSPITTAPTTALTTTTTTALTTTTTTALTTTTTATTPSTTPSTTLTPTTTSVPGRRHDCTPVRRRPHNIKGCDCEVYGYKDLSINDCSYNIFPLFGHTCDLRITVLGNPDCSERPSDEYEETGILFKETQYFFDFFDMCNKSIGYTVTLPFERDEFNTYAMKLRVEGPYAFHLRLEMLCCNDPTQLCCPENLNDKFMPKCQLG